MPTLNRDRLIDKSRLLGCDLHPGQADRLDRFADLLLAANRIHNLTAVTDPREMEIRHFLDCLALCALPELCGRVLDIGTGAGFPGVVIAITRPDCSVTLMDARQKKIDFVHELCVQLDLTADIVRGRAEEIRDPELLGCFDSVVARAVAPLARLTPIALPFLKKGGILIAMKGPRVAQELEETLPLLPVWGGRLLAQKDYELPGRMVRTAVIIQRVR